MSVPLQTPLDEEGRVCHLPFWASTNNSNCVVAPGGHLGMASLVPVAILIFAADPGFICFDFAHQLGELVVVEHRAENAMAHIEGGFEMPSFARSLRASAEPARRSSPSSTGKSGR